MNNANILNFRKVKYTKLFLYMLITVSTTSCMRLGYILNPFYETPPQEALLGEKNDKALYSDSEGGGSGDKARSALEAMSSYNRAHTPQPVNPVVQPAVVRLMWIPDHLNKNGDLVPAHYYYLKVLKDRWAVTDAFELESQLSGPNSSTDNMPYVKQN
jgi:hypothetical protein